MADGTEVVKTMTKSAPFSSEMDLALATSYIREKAVIEGALKGGKLTSKHKLAAWERVRGCVNAVAGGNVKTITQCKDRYRNLVQAITKRKWQVKATGGGPNPPPLSQAQHLIESSLSKLKMDGIEGQVDTFSGFLNTECSETSDDPEIPTTAARPESSACGVVMLDSVYSIPMFVNDDGHASSPLPSSYSVNAPLPQKRKWSMTVEEYMEKKLAVIEKEHILRSRMLLAQTKYYEIKAAALLKQM